MLRKNANMQRVDDLMKEIRDMRNRLLDIYVELANDSFTKDDPVLRKLTTAERRLLEAFYDIEDATYRRIEKEKAGS
jgi:hypothetical protein